MTTKFAKTTSKGQLTLPNEWRKQFNTDNYLMEIDAQKITIKPIMLDEIANEDLIFDADRDNNGKGILVDDMLKLLRKIKNEQN